MTVLIFRKEQYSIMSEWIAKLKEEYDFEKLEREMSTAQLEIAQTEGPPLMKAVHEQIKKDAVCFMQTFPHRRSFNLPKELPGDSRYMITDSYPLVKLTYGFDGTVLLVEREFQQGPRSAKETKKETLPLRAEINKGAWFEYNGEPLKGPED